MAKFFSQNALMADGYNTNEYDVGEDGKPKGQIAGGVECPSDYFHPGWNHSCGDLMVKGPDGLHYPARAFGPKGPFTEAQMKGNVRGTFAHDYKDGEFDGRNYGNCGPKDFCPPCAVYRPCHTLLRNFKDPIQACSKHPVKPCVGGPELVGTSLEGNVSDCTYELADDIEDPCVIGVINQATDNLFAYDEAAGEYAVTDNKVTQAMVFVGMPLKEPHFIALGG